METKQPTKEIRLRSGLTIFPVQEEALQQQLNHLLEKTSAKLILLVDITGQIIIAKGTWQENTLVALGALLAGDLAANCEISLLCGEEQPYQLTVRKGINSSTLVADINQTAALFIQIPSSIFSDKVWSQIKEMIPKITDILNECAHDVPPILLTNNPDQLSTLFDQELEAMWME